MTSGDLKYFNSFNQSIFNSFVIKNLFLDCLGFSRWGMESKREEDGNCMVILEMFENYKKCPICSVK